MRSAGSCFYASLLTDYAAAKEIRLFGLGGFFQRRLLTELRAIHRASERDRPPCPGG